MNNTEQTDQAISWMDPGKIFFKTSSGAVLSERHTLSVASALPADQNQDNDRKKSNENDAQAKMK